MVKLVIVNQFCSCKCLLSVISDPLFDSNWDFFFDVARNLLKAVSVIHDEKLVCFNIKSSNVLVSSDGKVKLVDLGRALFIQSTLNGFFVPSIAYAAPYLLEQVVNVKEDHEFTGTPQTDIYAIGVVLWELLYCTVNKKYVSPFDNMVKQIPSFASLPNSFTKKCKVFYESLKSGVVPSIKCSESPKAGRIPKALHRLLCKMFVHEGDDKYSIPQVLDELESAFKDYTEHKKDWNMRIASGSDDKEEEDEDDDCLDVAKSKRAKKDVVKRKPKLTVKVKPDPEVKQGVVVDPGFEALVSCDEEAAGTSKAHKHKDSKSTQADVVIPQSPPSPLSPSSSSSCSSSSSSSKSSSKLSDSDVSGKKKSDEYNDDDWFLETECPKK